MTRKWEDPDYWASWQPCGWEPANNAVCWECSLPAFHSGPHIGYLNMENIINAALKTGSDAIHPGWGFLAENEKFARMVMDAGLTWVGPPTKAIRLMGDKIEAKKMEVKNDSKTN